MSFRKPVTRKQRTGGDWTRGKWGGESEASSTIMASIQPATPKQRSNVPQGYDSTNAVLVITDTQLTTAEAEGQRSDLIVYRSEDYVVISEEACDADVLNHFEYVCALPDNAAARA